MEAIDKDYFESKFGAVEKAFDKHVRDNEKEHDKFNKEFFDVSQIIREDRDSINKRLDKITDNLQQISTIAVTIAEMKEQGIRTRENIQQLFVRQDEIKNDVNSVAITLRADMNNLHGQIVDEFDAKIETVGGRVNELEKIAAQAQAAMASIRELQSDVKMLKEHSDKGSGALSIINWIFTAAIGIVAVVAAWVAGG